MREPNPIVDTSQAISMMGMKLMADSAVQSIDLQSNEILPISFNGGTKIPICNVHQPENNASPKSYQQQICPMIYSTMVPHAK